MLEGADERDARTVQQVAVGEVLDDVVASGHGGEGEEKAWERETRGLGGEAEGGGLGEEHAGEEDEGLIGEDAGEELGVGFAVGRAGSQVGEGVRAVEAFEEEAGCVEGELLDEPGGEGEGDVHCVAYAYVYVYMYACIRICCSLYAVVCMCLYAVVVCCLLSYMYRCMVRLIRRQVRAYMDGCIRAFRLIG